MNETERKSYTTTDISSSNDKKWILVTVKEITKVSDNKKQIEETKGVIDRIEMEKLLAEMNKPE